MTIKLNQISTSKCNHILNPLHTYLMSTYDLLSLSCYKFLNFKIGKDEKFPSIHMEKWQNARILTCSNKDLSFGLFISIKMFQL